MGTRADFYLGRGADKARWLGSIAWDGSPDGVPEPLRKATTSEAYLKELTDFARTRDDWTSPDHGWPWPWDTSRNTDYAYAFDDGQVFASLFGQPWVNAEAAVTLEDWPDGPRVEFPDMREGRSVTWGRRSGLIVIGIPDEDTP